jgi:aspartate/methionine/tyrosine aminotransferase
MVSVRGTRAQARPFSYFDAFIKTFSDSYDAVANENGYINVAVAQNNLTVDMMHERTCRALAVESPVNAAAYDDMKGTMRLKSAMAAHMTKRLCAGNTNVSAGDLVLSAGAGAVIENLVFSISDEGEQVIIPAPYYPAFPNDLRARLGVSTVPCYSAVAGPDGSTLPTAQDYAELLDAQHKKGNGKCVAILLANPGNPTGVVYSAEQLKETIAWAVENKIHVISDEIYACSIFAETCEHAFVSAISIVSEMIAEAKERRETGHRCGLFKLRARHLWHVKRFLYIWLSSGDALDSKSGNPSRFGQCIIFLRDTWTIPARAVPCARG